MSDTTEQPVSPWQEGTSDEYTRFVEAHPNVRVETKYDPDAPADRQYAYRELFPPAPFRTVESCDLCGGLFGVEDDICRIEWNSDDDDGPNSTFVHYICAQRHPLNVANQEGTRHDN